MDAPFDRLDITADGHFAGICNAPGAVFRVLEHPEPGGLSFDAALRVAERFEPVRPPVRGPPGLLGSDEESVRRVSHPRDADRRMDPEVPAHCPGPSNRPTAVHIRSMISVSSVRSGGIR